VDTPRPSPRTNRTRRVSRPGSRASRSATRSRFAGRAQDGAAGRGARGAGRGTRGAGGGRREAEAAWGTWMSMRLKRSSVVCAGRQHRVFKKLPARARGVSQARADQAGATLPSFPCARNPEAGLAQAATCGAAPRDTSPAPRGHGTAQTPRACARPSRAASPAPCAASRGASGCPPAPPPASCAWPSASPVRACRSGARAGLPRAAAALRREAAGRGGGC